MPTDHPLSADLRLGEGGCRRTPNGCVWGGSECKPGSARDSHPKRAKRRAISWRFSLLDPHKPNGISMPKQHKTKVNTKHRLEPSDEKIQ